MKKHVRILAIGLLCIFIHIAIIAQNDTLTLEQVEVTASLSPSVYSESGRIVTIINRSQIENSSSLSLNTLLNQTAGVDIRQRGFNGVQADISIRGGNFDQSMILLNGIKINDPQTGHHNLNIPIDLEMIERIEILGGPAARTYGAGAFSGIINIVTDEVAANNLKLFTSAGQKAYYRFGAGMTAGGKRFSNYLLISKKASEGYNENTDFVINNFFFRSSFRGSFGNVSLQHGMSSRSFGAQSFYTPKYPNQFENLKTSITSLTFTSGKRLVYSQNLWYRFNNDRFELFRNTPPSWYCGHNYHQTEIAGAELKLSYISFLGKTTIGAEMRSESIVSNVLGEILDTPVAVKGENNVFYIKGKKRLLSSFFAGHLFSFGRWVWSAGAMFQKVSDFKNHIYPGMEIGYSINSKIQLLGSINKTLRFPSFTDLYYQGAVNQGNPHLKPEEALATETGIRFNSGNYQSSIVFFKRYEHNLIDWVRMPGENKWTTMNYTKVNTFGIELSASWTPKKQNEKYFIKSIGANYTYMKLSKHNVDYESYYVMDYLKNKICFNLSHRIIEQLSASWVLTFLDRNGTFNHYPSGDAVPYADFLIADLIVKYRFRNLNVWIEASNLFNTLYYDIGNVPLPGRWIIAGADISFCLKKD